MKINSCTENFYLTFTHISKGQEEQLLRGEILEPGQRLFSPEHLRVHLISQKCLSNPSIVRDVLAQRPFSVDLQINNQGIIAKERAFLFTISHLLVDFRDDEGVVLLDKALCAVYIFVNRLVRPPLDHVPIFIVMSTTVVKSVGQLVSKDGSNGAVVQ